MLTRDQNEHQAILPFGARFTMPLYLAMTLPAVLVARGVNALFVSLILGAAIGWLYRRRGDLSTAAERIVPQHTHHVIYAGLAFSAFAAVSSLWSVVPTISLTKGVMLAGIIVATVFMLSEATKTDIRTITNATAGFLLAMIIGAFFLSIELLSDQRMMRWIFELFPSLGSDHTNLKINDGRVVYLWDGDHNRVTCAVALLLIPALVAARASPDRRLQLIAYGVFATLFLAVLWKAEHQSSQLALVLAALVMILALWRHRVATFATYAGWSFAVLLIVPLVYWLYNSVELHQSNWIFRSAETRVVLWGHTAKRVAERPVLGIGAHATATYNDLQPKREFVKTPSRRKAIVVQVHHHAHNVYLQTWFELGAVGALLLLVWGICAVRTVSTLFGPEMGIWLSQLTATAAMAATSYGLWQFWFLVTIASAFVLLWISSLALRERRRVAEISKP